MAVAALVPLLACNYDLDNHWYQDKASGSQNVEARVRSSSTFKAVRALDSNLQSAVVLRLARGIKPLDQGAYAYEARRPLPLVSSAPWAQSQQGVRVTALGSMFTGIAPDPGSSGR